MMEMTLERSESVAFLQLIALYLLGLVVLFFFIFRYLY